MNLVQHGWNVYAWRDNFGNDTQVNEQLFSGYIMFDNLLFPEW